MMDDYGLIIDCPTEALATDSIPVQVQMCGNRRTYWDNDGIIDKALTVAVLRRDRPGLRFLAKIDPRAIMLPDEPLPGRPSDEELDSSTVMVNEKRTLDASAPELSGRGAADYFVTGALSTWWSGVRELRVTDPSGRVARSDLPRLGPDAKPWKVHARTAGTEGAIRIGQVGEEEQLLIAIPAGQFEGAQWIPRGSEQPWLSLVGFNLSSRGGACGGSFAIERDSDELDGEVAIPVSCLSLRPLEGEWLFLGVVGGVLLPPVEVTLRRKDAR